MESTQPYNRRLLAAARSLYQGRVRQTALAERVEQAEAMLTSWLLSSGTTHALLGLFEFDLAGGELVVAKRDVPDSAQLPLPYLAPPPAPAQLGFAVEEPGGALGRATMPRIADRDTYSRQVERLSGLSEPELATLARAVLSSLAAAEIAPLMARHEAGIVIDKPQRVYELLSPDMASLAHEQLRTLTLTTRNGLLGTHLVYQGTANEAPVRMAEVFRPAVVQQATGVIVAHNHPSGDPTPSADDHHLTRHLSEAATLLGIRLLDHIVIAASGFYSFRESGQLSSNTPTRSAVSDIAASTPESYGQDGQRPAVVGIP